MLVHHCILSLCGLSLLAGGPHLTTPLIQKNHASNLSEGVQITPKVDSSTPESCEDTEATRMAEATFENAEKFYKTKFLPYKIHQSFTTKEEANRVFKELGELSKQTRSHYWEVAKYGQSKWLIAARVRVGDVFLFQGKKFRDMPIPPEVLKLDVQRPEKDILILFREAIEITIAPLLLQARLQWKKGIEEGPKVCADKEWVALARRQLERNPERVLPPRRKMKSVRGQRKVGGSEPKEAPRSCRGMSLELMKVFKDSNCDVSGPGKPVSSEVSVAFSPNPLVYKRGEVSGELLFSNSSSRPVELRFPFSCGFDRQLNIKIFNKMDKQVNKAPKHSLCATAAMLCSMPKTSRFVIEPGGTAGYPFAFSARDRKFNKDCQEISGRSLPKGTYQVRVKAGFLKDIVSGELRIR